MRISFFSVWVSLYEWGYTHAVAHEQVRGQLLGGSSFLPRWSGVWGWHSGPSHSRLLYLGEHLQPLFGEKVEGLRLDRICVSPGCPTHSHQGWWLWIPKWSSTSQVLVWQGYTTMSSSQSDTVDTMLKYFIYIGPHKNMSLIFPVSFFETRSLTIWPVTWYVTQAGLELIKIKSMYHTWLTMYF